MLMWMVSVLIVAGATPASAADAKASWLPEGHHTLNIAAPPAPENRNPEFPAVVEPFFEHVRGTVECVSAEGATGITVDANGHLVVSKEPKPTLKEGENINAQVEVGGAVWCGTDLGLYKKDGTDWKRHESYGVDGPLATKITALACDAQGSLWVGTPIGLSLMKADGTWTHVQGKQGMPYECVTALACASNNDLWIGTTFGAILYKPYETSRKWFYRQGKRYLPGDRVFAVALAPAGMPAYFLTDGGIGKIEAVPRTLQEKAEIIEKRVSERHRRLGMVAACKLEDAENPTSHTINDNDNDGLWTAYHVAAMALCFGATKDEAAKASATESMHALYMLQNASGVPGLVARSVLPPEIGQTRGKQWQPTPDGAMYWKSDTSSDEIDGHYLAFYTFYEHIAQHDDAEKELIIKQVRALTDHLVDNGYQLIDWHGKRTKWGFWDPKTMNESPMGAVEAGLNSLQILSFLKVAHHITGDKKYEEHYRKLIVEHGYLSNILLTKKSFPDSNNHSDDQLGYVAWYPILQLETDQKIRRALVTGVRRHYEVVRPEQPSFYTFVTATAAPNQSDILGAVENLRQIPTDRRLWPQLNSQRADVSFSGQTNRFGKRVLTRVVPADERVFEKWNADPYLPDGGHGGNVEDDGAAYLLPYWMGRFHGFIAEK
jgi:hypothetical protein